MNPVTAKPKALTRFEIVALAALVAAVVYSFATPPEATQGHVAKLFNLHLPTIAVAYLAFGGTLVASVGYLVTRKLRWDHIAVASAEVGVVFTGLTIAVGMIWAKPTWTVYWTWSARLTLTAIMFFVYLGYLALRRAFTDPDLRASRSAVFGILSIVQIPIIHFSVTWWRDIHQDPTVLRPDEMQIDGVFLGAFLFSLVAFVLVGVGLVRRRYHLARLEAITEAAVMRGAGGIAGDAVTAPQVDLAGDGAR